MNERNDTYILKGGTSLMMCYNLDRFSENIDLDGLLSNKPIADIVDSFCKENNYSYRVAKDTNTVKRFFVNYGNDSKPLKIEISYRQRVIPQENITVINGIAVYDINLICQMKAAAYQARDKVRDLYDLSFIFNHYYERLSSETVNLLRNAIAYKGIEQFDYIVSTQKDELIDFDKLTDDFLNLFDKLDLLYTEEEKALLAQTKSEQKSSGKKTKHNTLDRE